MPITNMAGLKRGAAAHFGAALIAVVLSCLNAPPLGAQYSAPNRDSVEQPEKVMEVTGVKPGMVIGEIGAGRGYFTFWLSRGVGEKGKVYANDIDRSALASIERTCAEEKITNIETVLGTVEDPRFPRESLDMVFMVNAFHDLERPLELLANLLPDLKPDATVVIMDRDPARTSDRTFHDPRGGGGDDRPVGLRAGQGRGFPARPQPLHPQGEAVAALFHGDI